jgi:hypothetical protein
LADAFAEALIGGGVGVSRDGHADGGVEFDGAGVHDRRGEGDAERASGEKQRDIKRNR